MLKCPGCQAPLHADAESCPKCRSKFFRCSFCRKHQNVVRKLIAGATVYICAECIELGNDIIGEERAEGR